MTVDQGELAEAALLTAVLIEPNIVVKLPPIRATAEAIAIEIPPAINAYSMAVAARCCVNNLYEISCKNRVIEIIDFITDLPRDHVSLPRAKRSRDNIP